MSKRALLLAVLAAPVDQTRETGNGPQYFLAS